MKPIWLGLSTSAHQTHVVAMRGPQTILRAQLCPYPSSGRAVTGLLEALALWEGTLVRAAVVVDESSTSSCPMMLYRDAFAFSDSTPLYRIEWIPRAVPHRSDSEDGNTSDEMASEQFDDLQHLLSQCVIR